MIEYEKTRNKKKKKNQTHFCRNWANINYCQMNVLDRINSKGLTFPTKKKSNQNIVFYAFPRIRPFGNYITVIESTFDFIWTKFSVGIFFFQWFLLSLLTVRNNKVLIKVNSFKFLSVRKSVRNRSVRFSTLIWTLTQTLKRFEYIGQNVIHF